MEITIGIAVVIAIICLVLGALVGYLFSHGKTASLQAMFDMLSVENERLKGEKEQIKQE